MSEHLKVLDGKRALVVGGGGTGIGRSICLTLADAGADVAVVDISETNARMVSDEVATLGVKSPVITGDVALNDDVDRIVREAREGLGGIDVLVTVVGGTRIFGAPPVPVHEMTDHDVGMVLEMNVRYVFRVVRSVLNLMLEQGTGGSIVSIGSIAGGPTGAPDWAAYGAAKAGLVSLARTVAVEYGPHEIRMNVVSPGFIGVPSTADEGFGYERVVPLGGKKGRAEDIANAVLFFASPQSSYVSGQLLLVDGGVTARFPGK